MADPPEFLTARRGLILGGPSTASAEPKQSAGLARPCTTSWK